MNKGQITWINCTRLIAILAVMLDHTWSMLYEDPGLRAATHFAVSLFILVSGYTSYLTGEKHRGSGWIRTFWHRSKKILIAYLVATLVYTVLLTRFFDLLTFLSALVHFNASGPLYYVALYLQLMLIFPPLYALLRVIPSGKKGVLLELMLGAALLLLGILTTKATNLLDIAGGGGKLFGGTFLFLFYFGMIAEKHGWFSDEKRSKAVLFLIAGGGLFILLECMIYRNYERMMTNPPGVLLICAAIAMLFFCYGVFTLLEQAGARRFTSCTGWLGKHTLYLFLYHRLFLDTANHFLRLVLPLWLKWIVYFAVMLLGPLLTELVFHKIYQLFSRLCPAKEDLN